MTPAGLMVITAHVGGGAGRIVVVMGPIALAAVGAAYAVGLRRLWRRAGTGRVVRRWQPAAYGGGLLVLLAALGPPLDAWADSGLTGHMVQHLLLVYVAAPLLVLGAPLPTLLWTLPPPTRRRLVRLQRRVSPSPYSAGWAACLAGAVVAHLVAIWTWHLPVAFQGAVRSNGLHVAQHASFLGSAVVLWWVLLVATRRSARGAGVLALFATTTATAPLGFLMTLSSIPWYPIYGRGPGAIEDQQVAGSIMWGFGGGAAAIGAFALFLSWLNALDRENPPPGESTRG